MLMAITVLIVDDQALFREGLHTLLTVYDDIHVVAEAANGQEAIALVQQHRPDVVLMDVRMPHLDGVAATRQICAGPVPTRVIMLTTFDDDKYVFEGLRAGAAGYLLKDVPSGELLNAIRAAARGDSFLQPSVAAKVVAEFARLLSAESTLAPPQPLVEPLSQRELEILAILANGTSNREIANQLFLAEGTVKNHVSNILSKMGVRDRTQAALKGKELGLI
jgi:DNA-binding NarL/FixJ family response regulator